MLLKVRLGAFIIFLGLASCQKNENSITVNEVVHGRRSVLPSDSASPSEHDYMSGAEFCRYYKDITSKEFGRFVSVPLSYSDPKGQKIQIYVYSMRQFDPKKPTYIFIDGGPGQNTHGIMGEYTDGAFNELRFDQRGLGCSAMETFSLYKNAAHYSTRNTVQDLESIREAFGVKKWTVYGVSYGTVPATVYAHLYPQQTASIVLEGTFSKIEFSHDMSLKASKLNFVVSQLSPQQKSGFDKLMLEDSDDSRLIQGLLVQSFYQDHAIEAGVEFLKTIIKDSGEILRDKIKMMRRSESQGKAAGEAPRAQAPGILDSFVMQVIYCRDLGYRKRFQKVLRYSVEQLFFLEEDASKESGHEICDRVGVSQASEETFDVNEMKTSQPVFYFQGSDDMATMAEGSFQHWARFAQGPSYFLLAEQGGHNPNLDRLESEDDMIALHQKVLFGKALAGLPLAEGDIESANGAQSDHDRWFLFIDKEKSWDEISKLIR